MSDHEPACCLCRFWSPIHDGKIGVGQCRVGRPSVDRFPCLRWPEVHGTEWCGEFVDRVAGERRDVLADEIRESAARGE